MDEDNRPAATSSATPRVLVTLPSVEDLHSVLVLLRAAGAQITTRHREFEISGTLTARQAAAVWALARHRDGDGEGNQLSVRISPGRDLRAMLDVMAPDGWSEDAFELKWPYDDVNWQITDDWWNQQQKRQAEMNREAPRRHRSA